MSQPSPSALSVDLFDTLILRATVQPLDVLLRVGVRGMERGLLRPHVTPSQFQVMRQAAEEHARAAQRTRTGSSEVTLREIYEQLPEGVVATTTSTMVALELDVERELVYPHPRTLERVLAARARGQRIAILSDTWFSAEQVSSLIRSIGIAPELFNDILTSSDERVSKHEGGLFARLLQRWPSMNACSILHIGDHRHGDVVMAARAGLQAEWHETGVDATRDHERLEALRHGTLSPELVSLRRLACGDAGPQHDAWWFSLGASILGALMSAFADWVVESCARDGIRTVRPLMREGAILAPMIAAAARQAGIELDVRPLCASRASTWLASIDAFGEADARQLLQRQQLTVAEALAAVGLRADDAPEVLQAAATVRLGLASHTDAGDGLTVEEALLHYLADPAVRREIDQQAANARSLVRQFIDQECGPSGDVALVDIGFKGTTGVALARAASHAGRRFHQFLVFGAERVTHAWRAGHDVRVFAAGPVEHADLAGPIARYPAVLESLLVTGGTTLGYHAAGGTVVPVLEGVRTPGERQHATATCRAGIIAFQERWLQWRRLRPQAARSVASSQRRLVVPVHRLLTMPTATEARRLGRLVHQDNDGGVSERPIVNPGWLARETSADDFLASALESAASFDRSWLWPAGACEYRWPGAIERQWRLVAGAPDGAPGAIPALALRARAAGVERLVVWGAGEMGSALIKACRTAGVDVAGVTDSNPALWGSSVEGVPVLSPAEARDRGPHVYAIGSLAFAADIEQALRRDYRATANRLQVFSPAEEEAA